jgi:hypothetical protein
LCVLDGSIGEEEKRRERIISRRVDTGSRGDLPVKMKMVQIVNDRSSKF